MPSDKIPVERAGGRVVAGPWPDDVDELVVGGTYDYRTDLADGSVQTVQAEVVSASYIGGTDGTVVAVRYEDPTLEVNQS